MSVLCDGDEFNKTNEKPAIKQVPPSAGLQKLPREAEGGTPAPSTIHPLGCNRVN